MEDDIRDHVEPCAGFPGDDTCGNRIPELVRAGPAAYQMLETTDAGELPLVGRNLRTVMLLFGSLLAVSSAVLRSGLLTQGPFWITR